MTMRPFRIRTTELHSSLSLLLRSNQALRSSQLLSSCSCAITTSTYRQAESRELKGFSQSEEELLERAKDKQRLTPWHREGANLPPVRRQRSAGAMVKGKLLTTPSRLLKLVIPLMTRDGNEDRKSVEPLALVVHPQQPLSYLERLIQSELPAIKNDKGDQKIPAVYFKAENSPEDEMNDESNQSMEDAEEESDGLEETKFDGKVEKTGVINPRKKKDEIESSVKASSDLRGGPGEGGVETYSGAGREGPSAEEKGVSNFVRWSSSTEIGDFIRDAARGKEFVIEVEGLQAEIRVGVPSFRDRTHYLRQRLRHMARQISELASVKEDCDREAHRAAQRVAMSGFALLVVWWFGVYYLTFKTDLGWDTMEPVTYLVGLSGLMCGYLWFLYHNREVSYRAAMNLTISRRQSQLYAARGFRPERWEELVREGNALRAEIKAIAAEYDVEWNEHADEHDESVTKALKKERDKHKRKEDEQEDAVDDTVEDADEEKKEKTEDKKDN